MLNSLMYLIHQHQRWIEGARWLTNHKRNSFIFNQWLFRRSFIFPVSTSANAAGVWASLCGTSRQMHVILTLDYRAIQSFLGEAQKSEMFLSPSEEFSHSPNTWAWVIARHVRERYSKSSSLSQFFVIYSQDFCSRTDEEKRRERWYPPIRGRARDHLRVMLWHSFSATLTQYGPGYQIWHNARSRKQCLISLPRWLHNRKSVRGQGVMRACRVMSTCFPLPGQLFNIAEIADDERASGRLFLAM